MSITHRTRMDYAEEVSESVMDARLGPLEDADQAVRHFALKVTPGGHVRRYADGLGNAAHLLTSMRPHQYLEVRAESEVETYLDDPFRLPEAPVPPLDALDRAEYLAASPLVPYLPTLADLAARFRADDPFESVRRMAEYIHRDFTYRQHVTDVTTSIEHVLELRQGVCQDFAHLLIGLCRASDIPARYASGYIVTGDDGNAPTRGEGASHAWVEAFTPSHGWRGFDPTNNLVANDHYVKIAIGRDYQDVPPTRGTYHGPATEQLTVQVSTRILA